MEISYIGHSCFKIESKGRSIVLDPYADGSVPGLSPVREKADAVFCSHGHGDHNAADLVELTGSSPAPLSVTTFRSWHDDAQGSLRGGNLITVVDDGESRLVHLGDLGHRLSDEQIEALGRADCLLVPVGGYYTIDAELAAETAERIGAAVTVPMHFRGEGFGYDVIGTVDAFLKHFENIENKGASSYRLGAEEGRKVVLLSPGNKQNV